MSGPFRDAYAKQRVWLRKCLLAVIDQGLISGSNFLLAILLARWLPAEQYGAYALSFAVFVLFSFLQQGLFLEPMSVFGPSTYQKSQSEYLGSLLWLQAALAALILIGVVIPGALYLEVGSGMLRKAFLGMALSAPCVLLYWFARRAYYLQLRPSGAVAGAMFYSAILASVVWFCFRTGTLSPLTAFLAIGFSALMTSIRQLRDLRPSIVQGANLSGLKDIGNRHWQYGRWAIVGSLFMWIPWNIYYPVVGRFFGLAEVAKLRALLNLVLPVTQLLSAFSLLFLPLASHIGQQENWLAARKLGLKLATFFGASAAVYWLPVCLFRVPFLRLMYAGHYLHVSPFVPWIALSSVLSGMALGPTIALRAMRSPASVGFTYGIAGGLSVVLGIPATHSFGISGAIACNVLSSFVALALGWTMLAKQERQALASQLVGQEAVP